LKGLSAKVINQAKVLYLILREKGIMKYTNGESYDGSWRLDKPHGKGKYISHDYAYEGNYMFGRKQGKGIMKFKNGDIYEGEFMSDLFHGEGIFKHANGDIYQGHFENGTMHEQGILNAL